MQAQSAQLETLVALARDDRVATASSAALTVELDERIGRIDASLSQPGLGDAERASLWRERVATMRELAGIETTRRWMTASGERYDGALVSGRSSPGLAGQMEPEQALEQLLAGTGLSYRFTGANTVVLAPGGAPAAKAQPAAGGAGDGGPVMLGPLKVMARHLGRFFQIPLPMFKPYVVFGPEANRKVLVTERDKVLWRNTDPVTDLLRHGVLIVDGAEHDHYRNLMEPTLHPSHLPISCRAQRSRAINSARVGVGLYRCCSRTARQAGVMSRNRISPARKRPTAASLAALSTAPDVPPRRATA